MNLTVHQGETVAIVGPTGAGKDHLGQFDHALL
jgi:ABC-type multidrug transport system fused ATPase/permease subunit